jgi:hypothetical protein
VAETTVKKLLCCGFLGQVYRCWWRICREINAFFLGSHITFFIIMSDMKSAG